MAAKRPIVATNVGGVSEAVMDRKNGYLVPPRDSVSLAKAMLELINNPENARKMGIEGREMIDRKFNMNMVSQTLTDIYESALQTNVCT
jgi:glycosyltransferase involved in cell wall biosynthesis